MISPLYLATTLDEKKKNILTSARGKVRQQEEDECNIVSNRPKILEACFQNSLLSRCIKCFILLIEAIVELEDTSNVSTTIAIVWGTPNSHDSRVKHELVPFQHELMRSSNEINVVLMCKLLGYIFSKEVASSSW